MVLRGASDVSWRHFAIIFPKSFQISCANKSFFKFPCICTLYESLITNTQTAAIIMLKTLHNALVVSSDFAQIIRSKIAEIAGSG